MTERLRQLLGGEADGLPIPPPATNAVIRQGRSLRRRNRIATGAGAAAAAVIVGGTFVAVAGGSNDQAAPDPTSPVVSGSDRAAASETTPRIPAQPMTATLPKGG